MTIKPLALANKINPAKIVAALETLQSPNRLPITAIEGAVLSVNGQTGHVTISSGGGTTITQVNSDWNSTGGVSQILNKPTIPVVDYPVTSVNSKTKNVVLSASDVGAADKQHTHPISDITDLATTLASKMDKSSQISYSQISDAPALFSGKYSDLTGSPVLATIAESGSYVDLKDKPVLFNGDYNSLTNKPTIPEVNYPVTSVNSKTGVVSLTYSDVGAAATNHSHGLLDVIGLVEALNGKWSKSENIPYSSISGTPVIPAAQVQSDWSSISGPSEILNKPVLFDGNYNSLTNKPTIPTVNYPVVSVNAKVGAVVLTNSDVGAAATIHQHAISDITGLQSALNGKVGNTDNIAYSRLTGTPTIPAAQVQSDWNATTGLGVILNKPTIPTVSYPVTSVNTKTGAVALTYTDVAAAPTAQGTKYVRMAGTQASGVKVKYYTATTDTNGAWTLSLGTDFTEILDVQVQGVSTAGATGIRQATLNAYTSTATSLTGSVYGNTVIATLLVTALNSLTLIPSAVVRIRVEGIGV